MTNVHPVDERLGAGRLAVLGLQHVLVLYAGAVAAPVVLAAGLGLPAADVVYLVATDLLLCGLGTLLQSLGVWKVGVRMPMVLGAAFTSVAPMLVIAQGHDIRTMYGALLVSGVFMVLAAPLFARLLRFFPPVVMGTAITLIGIQLVPVAAGMIVGVNPAAPGFGGPGAIGLALVVVVVVVAVHRFLPSGVRQVSILLGLLVGTGVAVVLGLVDLGAVFRGPVVGFPEPFHFGLPSFEWSAILSLIIIQIVIMVECAGQVQAVGTAVDKPVGPADVAASLRADGLITMLASVFQSFMYVTYAQNIGMVSVTKVRSRYVTAVAGGIALALSFFPFMGRVVSVVPQPVLGGAALVMVATVALVGVRILSTVDLQDGRNLVVVAVSVGVGLLPTVQPAFYSQFPPSAQLFLSSSVATGTVVAFVLNLVLPQRKD
ncbi:MULTISPECIES: nucleobase:cation symporter-2 family protein [unclassified Crossiella]|uniref:nucleobase:cation symporter-2 family protein n=1 Tax=unclassified Crossiella TaxID=2620835 RepID=UPI001FFF3417|nr:MULTISPECIES: nucleobase:cation symporter-2 family protein [unclassified Crossiella]MCK2241570.1 purine permease [Crossiella sp. S99.2]MCK2255558.1 purine permease [Crossiella sp. S99.1]